MADHYDFQPGYGHDGAVLDAAPVPAAALKALTAALNSQDALPAQRLRSVALRCSAGDVPTADAMLLRLQALAFLCHERRLSPWVTYDGEGQWDISWPAFLAAARCPLRIVDGRTSLNPVEFETACIEHFALG
ncbi:hypothetical protein [Piscinibacter terrae]|uniref:Uncharacterized protein n=1 Tax=Piscinibacter terrae TaxID=2496871 RepID=A0A3N7HMG3_9BURK|nr:hypothetical protein [Albitalea terrae]RQP23368.1 hypothetical protein DZC73_19950 [Albitalea terrae]